MIYTTDFTTTEDTFRMPREYLEQLTEQGLEGLLELIRVVVNEAMRIERENYLQARPTSAMRSGRPGWVKSPLRFHRYEKAGTTPTRWKKAFAVNGLC